MTKERSIVLIDDSNFYFKIKDLQLHNLLNLDFSEFIKSLIITSKLIEATYYVGAVKTDGTQKTQTLFNNQRKLLTHLKKHRMKYSLGYLGTKELLAIPDSWGGKPNVHEPLVQGW